VSISERDGALGPPCAPLGADAAGSGEAVPIAQAEAVQETFGFTPAKLSGPAATVKAIVPALAQLGLELPK
jgi:hypothetical protein